MGGFRVGNTPLQTAVSVATGSATQLFAERIGRKSVVVQNLDAANPIFVGNSTVTSTDGVKVTAGQSISFDDFLGKLYARATGGAVDTRVLEVF